MDKKKKRNDLKKKIIKFLGVFLCITGGIMFTTNMLNMYKYLKQQCEQKGEARIEVVSNNMQRTLDKSKTNLLRFAADVEVYLATNADLSEMRSYLKSQSSVFHDQSEGTLINAYICTPDWVIISDSTLPEDYDVTQREWYIDTVKKGIDNINITVPYRDVFTGEMCFTSSLLLSDGKTVVALDFNLTQIQESVERMENEEGGESLIISRDGLLVGYTGGDCTGKKLEDVLPEYMNIYNRILYDERDSVIFNADINGEKNTVFGNRSGDWFFVYAVDNSHLYSQAHKIMVINFIPRSAIFVSFFAYVLYVRRKLSKGLADENFSGIYDNIEVKEIDDITKKITGFTKRSRNAIMSIMTLTMLVAVAFTGIVFIKWGNDRMERDVASYNYQLERWTVTQLQTLNMFTATISANPSVLDDYDYAVDYLDTIVKKYPEISAAYIARPGNQHEMTMNNGWVPNADYVVAERQWYIDTQEAETKMAVSSPYLDARTGLYCITFSKVVYDSKTNEEIGVFALDFYISNLTKIMEESYSDNGYAFLVDNSNLILSHPNTDYQTSADKSMNIIDTIYSDVKNNSGISFISDYDGKPKACISQTENVTGFTIIAVKDIKSVYGIVMFCGGIFIFLLAVCIVLLYRLIVRMINWQAETRQALVIEARKAAQADHAKSSFLAQMSHEIRTPINAVLGMNEMILRESKEENILSYASNAYNSGNALLSIINDILDISKIESGKLEIVNADYDLYSLVRDCYHMNENRAEKKGLKFTVHCDEKLPSGLNGDMFHVRQIVVNLITNAVKYTDKGSVELNISGDIEEDKVILHFSVKDTGIGIKPENLEKMFLSFQRFDLERNQTVEGTGLGLAICKQLTELMGGSIRAESVYGEGSTFMCDIPQKIVNHEQIGKLRLEHSAETIKIKQSTFTAEDARILVVDDVKINLMVFTNFLKDQKMQIDTAMSGKQCIELVTKNKYDIIFMDHMMPEMDGIETFKKLKELSLISDDTPVVMLTANAISGEEEKYLAAGFSSYLTKPLKSDKLNDMLKKFLPSDKIVYKDTDDEKSSVPKAAANESSDFFDIDTGIMYNGNSREMYFMVLRMYISGGPEKNELIRRLAENEEWKNYITEVHALKSTSLMIGAKQLSESAKELELAGKEENYALIKEKNDALLTMYEKVIETGKELLQKEGISLDIPQEAPDNESVSEISEEKLREYIARIKEACDNFDDDETARICDEARDCSYNGTVLSSLFDEVRSSIAEFEYDKASEQAQAILDKFELK